MIYSLYFAPRDSEFSDLDEFNTFKDVVEYVKENQARLKSSWFMGTFQYPTYSIEKEYEIRNGKPVIISIDKKVWDDDRNCERIIPVYKEKLNKVVEKTA